MVDRLVRALRLEAGVFGEIADDDRATGEALAVSVFAAVVANLAGGGTFVGRVIGGAVSGLIGVFLWASILFLAVRLLGGGGTYPEVLRATGYTAAPFALYVIPVVGLVGFGYSMVMQIRAMREVGEVSTGVAVATVLIPWGLFLAMGVLLLAVLADLLGVQG